MKNKKKVASLKMPATPKASELVLKALNNKGNVLCTKCHKPLDLNNVKIIKAGKAEVTCISCGHNTHLTRRLHVQGLALATDGSLHRLTPKNKMSKKDRKRQKAIEKGWA